MDGDQVAAVRFEDLESGEQLTITAGYVLDATEEGDLLPLTGCESVVGAESAASTGEPTPWTARRIRRTSRPSPGAPPWSGGKARTTPSTARRAMSSGKTTGPTSGLDLTGLVDPRPETEALEPSAVFRCPVSVTCGHSAGSGTAATTPMTYQM